MLHTLLLAKQLIAGCIFICFTLFASAQRPVDRNLILNPLYPEQPESDTVLQVIPGFGGWATFGGYLFKDPDHAWSQQLGSFIELLRWGYGRSSLGFTTQIEFIADPDNSINFNPRAIFWEEGLVFTRETGDKYWQVGYFHRCKHDIDNMFIGRERSLIYGSLQGKVLWPWETLLPSGATWLSLQSDFYTFTYDQRQINRETVWDFSHNLERLILTLRGNIHLQHPLGRTAAFFVNAYASGTLLGAQRGFYDRFSGPFEGKFSGGVSTGVVLTGNGHFRLGLDYEYLSDTGIPILPRNSHLLQLRLMAHTPGIAR